MLGRAGGVHAHRRKAGIDRLDALQPPGDSGAGVLCRPTLALIPDRDGAFLPRELGRRAWISDPDEPMIGGSPG